MMLAEKSGDTFIHECKETEKNVSEYQGFRVSGFPVPPPLAKGGGQGEGTLDSFTSYSLLLFIKNL